MEKDAEGALSGGREGRPSAVEPGPRGERLVVVTGLPRSGTSMAMRMLGAGGLRLVDDRRRAPTPDNPHGWFEDERVRRLRADADWLRAEVGAAVKIVLPLASAVPDDLPCDFVWMRRPVREVLESQRRMLARAAGEAEDEALARAFERACDEFARRRVDGRRVLDLDYATVLASPGRAADALAAFVGEPFDRAGAARAVDGSLGRSTPR